MKMYNSFFKASAKKNKTWTFERVSCNIAQGNTDWTQMAWTHSLQAISYLLSMKYWVTNIIFFCSLFETHQSLSKFSILLIVYACFFFTLLLMKSVFIASTLRHNTDIHTEVKPSHLNLISCGGRWCLCNGGSGLEQTHGGLDLQRQTETGGKRDKHFHPLCIPAPSYRRPLSGVYHTVYCLSNDTADPLCIASVECCYLLWHGSCVILNFEI